MALLDKDYSTLSLTEQNEFLKSVLQRLVDSSAVAEECRDCLEQFDFFDWTMRPDADPERYQQLLNMGKNDPDNFDEEQLNEFLLLASDEGDTHLYFELYRAKLALQNA